MLHCNTRLLCIALLTAILGQFCFSQHFMIASATTSQTWEQLHYEQQRTSSRKLLQQLPLAREGNINRLGSRAVGVGVDSTLPSQITATSGTRLGLNVLRRQYSANGYPGGWTKGLRNVWGATNRDGGQTSSSAAYKSVSDPTYGSTTSRTGIDSVVLHQTETKPAKSDNNSSTSTSSSDDERERSKSSSNKKSRKEGSKQKKRSSRDKDKSSSSSSRKKGRQAEDPASPSPAPVPPLSETPAAPRNLDVLLAANLDYSIAGDSTVVLFRDYTFPDINRLDRRKLDPYSLDYDYGQPHLLPQSAQSTSSQDTKLEVNSKRAQSTGATSAMATGQAVTARSHSTSTSLKGNVWARKDDDVFVSRRASSPQTAAQTVTPPLPLLQSGADAASSGTAKQYKGNLFPSVVFGASSSGSNVDASSAASKGSKSSTLSYTAGTQSVNTRSQSLAVGDCMANDLC